MEDEELRQFLRENLCLDVRARPFGEPWQEIKLLLRNEEGRWETLSEITLYDG